MIKIRLARYGNTNRQYYRIVALDERAKTTGQYLETFGTYNPVKSEIDIDKKKVEEWVKKGAQLSDSVAHLLKGQAKPKKIKKSEVEETQNSDSQTQTQPEASEVKEEVAEAAEPEVKSEEKTTESEAQS